MGSAMEDSSAMTANAQEFCLRWNNFHSSLVTALDGFKNDQDFVDVTLACEGQFLKAHKMLLSACSVFFRDLLKANPCQHPIVILPPEVRFADLEKLLRFIYQGEVNVHQENLARFLKTAEMLKIRGLAEDSEKQRVLRSSSPRPPEGGDSDSVSPKRPRLSIDVHQPSQEPQTPNDDSRLSGNDSDSEMIPVKQEMVELKDCSDTVYEGGDSEAFIPEAYLREGGSASSSQQSQQPAPPHAPPPPGPLLPSYVPPPQVKTQDDSPLGPSAPDELSQGRACVGELGSWGRRALPSPPRVMGGVVGAWGRSALGPGDVVRGGGDPTAASSGAGVGALLDLLGRGEEHPALEGVVTLPTPSGGRLCPICGRHISNPSNLRKHMHRAHGTRSYSCPACHKAYRVACDLRRHALAAHNIRMDSHYPSSGTSPPAHSRLQQGSPRTAVVHQDPLGLPLESVGLGDAELHLSPDTTPRTPTPDASPALVMPPNPSARAITTHLPPPPPPHPPTLTDTGTRPAARV
ncbi:protein bric-a-brac 2-like isoform X4 [Penaeus chinensis]|uniref:protein bric-a-brac 2-like isoform X4 n=1 Tax=Penaeus chinensis TaxID=139456 RepID=UPI001FB7C27F|nr:protein bric-a-brac 2-like isoform X4 [Penaeus chinensis]